MSTWLVTSAVVGGAIGVALWIALADPDQPATLRLLRRRAHRPLPTRPATAPSPARTRAGGLAALRAAAALVRPQEVVAAPSGAAVAVDELDEEDRDVLAPSVDEDDREVTTSRRSPPRHLKVADSWVLSPPVTAWRRLGSGAALGLIVVALGAVLAGALALVAMLFALAFQQALS